MDTRKSEIQKPLKTLGKTTWDKIKINEVFAWDGCWVVMVKIADRETIVLADDWNIDFHLDGIFWSGMEGCELYKLPKSVQRLWKEE